MFFSPWKIYQLYLPHLVLCPYGRVIALSLSKGSSPISDLNRARTKTQHKGGEGDRPIVPPLIYATEPTTVYHRIDLLVITY